MSRVVVVTGAGKGIGWHMAEAFAAAGYVVVATDVAVDEVSARIASAGYTEEQVVAMSLNVTKKDDFAAVLAQTVARFGRCDVLVNNAGITPTTPVMDISPEEFSQVLDVNLKGCFVGCQVFGAHFESIGDGRIINMASLAGQMGGTASGAHYAASKAGIITLTKIFARQLAGSGTTVNAIAPGPVDVESITEKVSPEKLQNIIETMVPVKKMTSPDFLGSMAVMLASESAATVTGATWDVNGGIYMR